MESQFILPLEHHDRPTILKLNNINNHNNKDDNNDNNCHHHHIKVTDDSGIGSDYVSLLSPDSPLTPGHNEDDNLLPIGTPMMNRHNLLTPGHNEDLKMLPMGSPMIGRHWTPSATSPDSLLTPGQNEDMKLLPMGSPMIGRHWTPSATMPSSPMRSRSQSGSRYRGSAVRKQRRRAVFKNGECNVLKSRISHRRLRYLQDLFTTFVDTQWRWTLLVFALSFILSWLTFATVWWLIAFTHGDFEPEHQLDDTDWKPCIVAIHDFTSCFLFSIETQHTIGYGSRSTTEECPEAIFVMCLQSITGVMIQAFMVGIVFAKMTRPKRRTQTLLFSRNAVICQRDGDLCLMFRVGDMRKSHIIGSSVRALLIRSRTTKEGEVIPQCQIELQVGTDGGTENLFFIWPMTIVHRIDSSSPFYRYSAADLVERDSRMEVVVILEGTIESTGQTTQARSSYLPSEMLWGHRFEPMVEYSKERQGYEVDYSRFNNTYQVDTPLCSARELTEFYKIQDDLTSTHPGLVFSYGDSTTSTASTSTPETTQRKPPAINAVSFQTEQC